MAKFAAQRLGDLLTVAANRGRKAREVCYVVHVEADDGSWCELDASGTQHARTLADNWVAKMNARGASCRMVNQTTGKCFPNPFYTVYDMGPDTLQDSAE